MTGWHSLRPGPLGRGNRIRRLSVCTRNTGGRCCRTGEGGSCRAPSELWRLHLPSRRRLKPLATYSKRYFTDCSARPQLAVLYMEFRNTKIQKKKTCIPVWVLARDSSFPFRRLSRLGRLRHPSNEALSHLTFPFLKTTCSPTYWHNIHSVHNSNLKNRILSTMGSWTWVASATSTPQTSRCSRFEKNHTCFSFDTSKQKQRNLLKVV